MDTTQTPAEGHLRMSRGGKGIGYWVVLDLPLTTERIAGLGYDWIVLDDQHGDLGATGLTRGLQAAAAAGTAGYVRVKENSLAEIGRALDRGAAGVVIPLVDSAADAERAVFAAHYPPLGGRSYGPLRAHPSGGVTVQERNHAVRCIMMVETPQALDNLEEIAAVPGVDALYIGPSDLMLALGGSQPGDLAFAAEFECALARIREVAAAAGIAAGMHTPDGDAAAQRLAEGFDFVSIASDLGHLTAAAAAHLARARA